MFTKIKHFLKEQFLLRKFNYYKKLFDNYGKLFKKFLKNGDYDGCEFCLKNQRKCMVKQCNIANQLRKNWGLE